MGGPRLRGALNGASIMDRVAIQISLLPSFSLQPVGLLSEGWLDNAASTTWNSSKRPSAESQGASSRSGVLSVMRFFSAPKGSLILLRVACHRSAVPDPPFLPEEI